MFNMVDETHPAFVPASLQNSFQTLHSLQVTDLSSIYAIYLRYNNENELVLIN